MLLVCFKFRSVVDGLEIVFVDSDVVGLVGWKLKDFKVCLDIFFYC